MKVKVNSITGFADMFVAMFISKRTWTPELDEEIRYVCNEYENGIFPDSEIVTKFNKWLEMSCRMMKKHITIGRYLNISIMTEGLHRAGQDDLDAHACRFDNRIIRSSTRLANFEQDEFSDFYKDKVMTTDTALKIIGFRIPDTFTDDSGTVWVKSPNGYVKEQYKDDKDVKRGLYMLGIPSNFISQINVTEWAHVYKQRGEHGGANPEVKEWAEAVADQIEELYPQLNRELWIMIEN